MTILVINCGSSSVKASIFSLSTYLEKLDEEQMDEVSSYSDAIERIIYEFKKRGISFASLKAAGHRVVHGGSKYLEAVIITPEVENDLEELSELAPLHNPQALAGIRSIKKNFPNLSQAAFFDTAFHRTLPDKAVFYPLPRELAEKYRIKRYGFHGIAHQFSWNRFIRTQEKGNSRAITLHLGAGCSLTAIKDGRSIDTSMGFTPLDGIMMMTRSGELDPAIVGFLSLKERKKPEEIIDLLNRQSGILGVSELTDDMKELLKLAGEDRRANLALEMFIYSVQKKIGSYLAALEGSDALIFSGGIGENSSLIRQKLAQSLGWLGVRIDPEKNGSCIGIRPGEIKKISKEDSSIALFVVGSDESLFIAEELCKMMDL